MCKVSYKRERVFERKICIFIYWEHVKDERNDIGMYTVTKKLTFFLKFYEKPPQGAFLCYNWKQLSIERR